MSEYKERKLIDLTGKRFGKLVVLEFDHKQVVAYENGKKRTTYFWKCKCDCGNFVVRSGNSLRGGYTESCGCNKIAKRSETIKRKKQENIKVNTNWQDLTGKVFSKLFVEELDHTKRVVCKNGKKRTIYYWKCMCECGKEVIRDGKSLRTGATKSCGCYKFNRQRLVQDRKKYIKEIEEEFE